MLGTAETSSVFAIRELCPRLPQCDVKGKDERRRNIKSRVAGGIRSHDLLLKRRLLHPNATTAVLKWIIR